MRHKRRKTLNLQPARPIRRIVYTPPVRAVVAQRIGHALALGGYCQLDRLLQLVILSAAAIVKQITFL